LKNKFLLFSALIFAILFGNCKKQDATPKPQPASIDYSYPNGSMGFHSATVPDGDTIQSFSTTWIVPSTPFFDSTLFWWNGMDGGSLQPVLQWENGGWTIANWYFTDDYHHGQFVPVSPGDTLTGVIEYLSHTKDSFYYKESFIGYPDADVTFGRTYLATEVDECFEAYSTTYLAFAPDTLIKMTAINCITTTGIHPPNLNWTNNPPYIKTPTGHFPFVIVNSSSSNGEVDFYMK
jgi:hypothetical protein